jgi:hypothetical protein
VKVTVPIMRGVTRVVAIVIWPLEQIIGMI